MTFAHLAGPARGRIASTALLLLGLTTGPATMWAQWLPSGATSGPIYYTGGNVGIGTTSPSFTLDVRNGLSYAASGNWLSAVAQNTNAPGHNGLSVMNAWAGADSSIFEAAMGWNGVAIGYYPVFTVDGIGQVIFRPQQVEAMRITPSGSIGIGTANPSARFHTTTGPAPFLSPPDQAFGAIIANMNNVAGQSGLLVENAWSMNNSYAFQVASNWNGATNAFTPYFTVTGIGNVGIGTTSPCATNAPANCKLSVAGGIQAQEIVVNAGWSDYVFDPTYRLRPLSEIAAYIQANRHLPDIPTDAEVREKGVSVGDIQSKLLAKIEELTLHMVDLAQKSRELERQLKELQATTQVHSERPYTQERLQHNDQE